VFAAIALVVEVAILLIGVFFRFGLNQPLVWSDELASIVFLWLAMLGSVLAFWCGEHMRLTTVATRLRTRWQPYAAALATMTPLLLLLALLIHPSLDHIDHQSFVETPALGWPDSLRVLALPAGFGLMIVVLPVIRLWLTFGEGGSARPGVTAGIPSFVQAHRNLGAGLTSTGNATDMDAARALELGARRSATTFTKSEPDPLGWRKAPVGARFAAWRKWGT